MSARHKWIVQRELPPHPLVNTPTWLDVEDIDTTERSAKSAYAWRVKAYPQNRYRLVRVVEK